MQKQGEDSVMMLVGTREAKKEVGSILIQAVINFWKYASFHFSLPFYKQASKPKE